PLQLTRRSPTPASPASSSGDPPGENGKGVTAAGKRKLPVEPVVTGERTQPRRVHVGERTPRPGPAQDAHAGFLGVVTWRTQFHPGGVVHLRPAEVPFDLTPSPLVMAEACDYRNGSEGSSIRPTKRKPLTGTSASASRQPHRRIPLVNF